MADGQEPGKLTRQAEEGNAFAIGDLADCQVPGMLTHKAE